MSCDPGRYDVIVVGAGPAGTICALELSKKGYSVQVLDKKKEHSTPVLCAETVSRISLEENGIPLEKKWIANRVKGVCLHPSKEQPFFTLTEMLNIDRAGFDNYLAEAAVVEGADINFGSNVDRITRIDDEWEVGMGSRTVRARMLVGADGYLSGVAKKVGLFSQGKHIVGVQYKGRIADISGIDPHYNHIFFSQEYRNGYAWIFPRDEEVNVGIVSDEPSYKKLDAFITQVGLNITSRRKMGGAIPFRYMLTGYHDRRGVVIVGDAAGLTHPITYGGIHPALTSGRLAADAIARSFQYDDNVHLASYEKSIKRIFKMESSFKASAGFYSMSEDELNFAARLLKGRDFSEISNVEGAVFLFKNPRYLGMVGNLINIRKNLVIK